MSEVSARILARDVAYATMEETRQLAREVEALEKHVAELEEALDPSSDECREFYESTGRDDWDCNCGACYSCGFGLALEFYDDRLAALKGGGSERKEK